MPDQNEVVNEADFLGTNDMASLIAPKTQESKKAEKKSERMSVRAALLPATEILNKIIDEEVASNKDLTTYKPLISEANPDGNAVIQEFRARQLYTEKLKHLRNLIKAASKKQQSEDDADG